MVHYSIAFLPHRLIKIHSTLCNLTRAAPVQFDMYFVTHPKRNIMLTHPTVQFMHGLIQDNKQRSHYN
jgi:hypothetical protein